MSQTQILQLSDIHTQCGDKFDYSVVLDPLIERLRMDRNESDLRPELLIVSGDIAWSGKELQYKQAHEFLSEVCRELGIPDNAVFLVPGNHDVDRDKYTNAEKNKENPFPYSSTKELNKVLQSKSSRDGLFKGLKAYFRFADKNYPHLSSDFDNLIPFVSKYSTKQGNRTIGLLGLNTSWLSRYSPDEKKVAIGEYQLKKALENLKSKGAFDLGIACFHHPLPWLWDKRKCIRYLNTLQKVGTSGFLPLYLSGHLHDESAFFHYGLDGSYLQFQSGSIYLSSDAKWPQRFHYITIDWDKAVARLDFREYDPDDTKWILASKLGDEGNKSFPLRQNQSAPLGGEEKQPLLPDKPSDFVNRKNEISEIINLIENGRKVQVEGFGGIGKSDILALIAHSVLDQFENCVIYIQRTDKATSDVIINRIARLLGVYAPGTSKEQRIAEINSCLEVKSLLLILDNVVSENQSKVRDLIESFPNCRILFANRANEKIVIKNVARLLLEKLEEEDSILLFENKGNLSLSDEERTYTSVIHKKLAGVPLALELACRYMIKAQADVRQLAKWLDDKGVEILDEPEEKIKKIYQGSYEKLSKEEQKLFSILGIFGGETFDLESIQAISLIDKCDYVLSKLIAASLVKRDKDRYYMHPLIGMFAEEAFDPKTDTCKAAIQRMIAYYRDLISNNLDNQESINREINNIITAVEYTFRFKNREALFEIVTNLNDYYGFLAQNGYWREGISLNTLAMKAIKSLDKPSIEASFTLNTGLFHYWLGNHVEARSFFDQALQLYSTVNDVEGQIKAHHNLGFIDDDEDEYEKARDHYEESLHLAKSINNRHLTALGHHLVGVIDCHQKKYPEARTNMENCLKINETLIGRAREKNDISTINKTKAAIYRCKRRFAAIARRQAHYAPKAHREHYLSEAMDLISCTLKNERIKRSLARGKRQRGMIYEEMGDLDKALNDYEASLREFSSIGNTKGIGAVSYNLGCIAQKDGDHAKAIEYFEKSLEIAKNVKCQYGKALAYQQISISEEKKNNPKANEIFRKALHIFKEIKSPFLDDAQKLYNKLFE